MGCCRHGLCPPLQKALLDSAAKESRQEGNDKLGFNLLKIILATL